MRAQPSADNPVVLLSEGKWHVVDSSRESRVSLCGRTIRNGQAHSRLKTIGREHVCPQCLKVFDGQTFTHP